MMMGVPVEHAREMLDAPPWADLVYREDEQASVGTSITMLCMMCWLSALNESWPHILGAETLIRDMRSGPGEALVYVEWQLERWLDRAAMSAVRERFRKARARLGWRADHHR